jgi:ABC-type branched-subunit amino acid transport system ATPase component
MGMTHRSGRSTVEWLLATPAARAARRAMEAEAADLVAFWGLEPVAAAPAGGLRPGQQRIVELARALAGHPRLLVLDEPTRGAAPAELQAMIRRLRQLRDRGIAILIAEPHLRNITGIADHVVVLGQHHVIAEGSPRAIRDHAAAVALLRGDSDDDAATD